MLPKVIDSRFVQDHLLDSVFGVLTTLIRTDGHYKSAASEAFPKDVILKHMPPDDHYMLHMVIMGCGEDYGFNKNADFFGRDELRRNHPTFVSHGRMYREHLHHRPEQAIGKIAASAFSEQTKRVELLMHGHKKKSEREYEMAKAGKQLTSSMSCRVKYDICSCCRNEAKKVANYCSHLKDRPMQYIAEFDKFACAINPNPLFTDGSIVADRADRVAMQIDDIIEKSASGGASSDILSANLAIRLGLVGQNDVDPVVVDTLLKLASVERRLAALLNGASAQGDPYNIFLSQVTPIAFEKVAFFDDAQAARLAATAPDVLFRKLAKRGIMLPPHALWRIIHGGTVNQWLEKEASLADQLPTMFRHLADAMEAGKAPPECEACEQFEAGSDSRELYDTTGDSIDSLLDGAAEQFSCDADRVRKRLGTAAIIKKSSARIILPEKHKDVSADDRKLLNVYALYKSACVRDIIDLQRYDEEIVMALTVGQNTARNS